MVNSIRVKKKKYKKVLNKDGKLLTYLLFVRVYLRFKRIGFPKIL